jgi:hypothetical protein
MILCNIRRVQLGEDRNFLYDILDFVFRVLDIDDFDCYGLASSFVHAVNEESAPRFKTVIGAKPCPLYTLPKLPPPALLVNAAMTNANCKAAHQCNSASYKLFPDPS